MITNAGKGTVYYGMHFYPGVAEYSEPGKEPYRVFINEDTIRKMNPTFAGCPIFVEHVDDVEENIDDLRNEADGWVLESFFNKADGKTWVKFIVVSERAERAITRGFRLSNAYAPKIGGPGGLWNGVSYMGEVTDGHYEHLAIVDNPRYEESVILSPENFKKYNESKEIELLKLANSKGTSTMKLNIFKKQKVENSKEIDFDGLTVALPKSGKEVTLITLVNEADEKEMKKNEAMADGASHAMVGENKISINDLVKAYSDCMNELTEMKKKHAGVEEEAEFSNEDDEDMDVDDGDMMNEEDEDADEKKKKAAEDKKNAEDEAKAKKANAIAKKKENFDKLKNAESRASKDQGQVVETHLNQVARGKSRYGSGN